MRAFHLSIPLSPSLSLSLLLYPSLTLLLSLPLFLSLSYLSLPLYISPSTFLSLSFLLSLFSLSFSLAYLMDVFVLVIRQCMQFILFEYILIPRYIEIQINRGVPTVQHRKIVKNESRIQIWLNSVEEPISTKHSFQFL